MIIPYGMLEPETLRALIEDFITREGTDYGQRDYDLADKVTQVKAQLANGRAVITFDPESETTSIALEAPLARQAVAYEREDSGGWHSRNQSDED